MERITIARCSLDNWQHSVWEVLFLLFSHLKIRGATKTLRRAERTSRWLKCEWTARNKLLRCTSPYTDAVNRKLTNVDAAGALSKILRCICRKKFRGQRLWQFAKSLKCARIFLAAFFFRPKLKSKKLSGFFSFFSFFFWSYWHSSFEAQCFQKSLCFTKTDGCFRSICLVLIVCTSFSIHKGHINCFYFILS